VGLERLSGVSSQCDGGECDWKRATCMPLTAFPVTSRSSPDDFPPCQDTALAHEPASESPRVRYLVRERRYKAHSRQRKRAVIRGMKRLLSPQGCAQNVRLYAQNVRLYAYAEMLGCMFARVSASPRRTWSQYRGWVDPWF
jgi:hypothetical protein